MTSPEFVARLNQIKKDNEGVSVSAFNTLVDAVRTLCQMGSTNMGAMVGPEGVHFRNFAQEEGTAFTYALIRDIGAGNWNYVIVTEVIRGSTADSWTINLRDTFKVALPPGMLSQDYAWLVDNDNSTSVTRGRPVIRLFRDKDGAWTAEQTDRWFPPKPPEFASIRITEARPYVASVPPGA